jgi:hypothetical protein
MKALAIALVALGILIGLPGVIACFTIILLPIGIPMALAGAGIAAFGLHLRKGTQQCSGARHEAPSLKS